MKLGKEVARRRVRFIEFYSSVMLAGGLSAWLFYYVIWWIIALLIGYQPLYIALLCLPFLGWGALYYFEYFQRWIDNLRWSRLPAEIQKNILDLRNAANSQAGIG